MKRNILVTGGSGFIGSNYVRRLVQRGESVTVFDNLSRRGAELNLAWLRESYGAGSFTLVEGDICDARQIAQAARAADVIVHLAGQVAVTTSVTNPRLDFENNALGTFNVLEAARFSGRNPAVLYASTNKVYGGMEDIAVLEEETRYRYADFPLGIPETRALDFHSPYGCSKGCGDQYVRDYARIYDLPTIVLRQSCIYGPRQFGIEDQGWIAWFIIAVTTGKPITIFGNGKQVRDVLFVDDLLDAYDAALDHIEEVAGEVFNIGGGARNTLSVWMEFRPILERLFGRAISFESGDWRPGDQPVFISDVRKAARMLGWTPKIGVEEGIERLFRWVQENRNLFV